MGILGSHGESASGENWQLTAAIRFLFLVPNCSLFAVGTGYSEGEVMPGYQRSRADNCSLNRLDNAGAMVRQARQ
jgi:hypothetical protein